MDLCRQSIVFQSVSDLVSCFRTLAKDEEIVLVRVKNRLDPSGGSSASAQASAGFRNLAVNLRFDTDYMRRLGLDLHICEVQLMLMKFAEIKVSQSIVVNFRNLVPYLNNTSTVHFIDITSKNGKPVC